ncbi:MAG: zinc ABC transporter substrate-binding protein [Clostridia bacterium]|nr:zinc ABC transporter substrate-binding protein [Clostridia bacterium]
MKKWLSLLTALVLCAACCCGCAAQGGDAFTVVTSFYPMYVLTLNVTAGIDGVEVVNMADQNVGCLHDYQLQTRDMVTLEDASAMVINGGGMEQFMEKVFSLREDLPVIEASVGIEMLCSGHEHEHEDEHHEHEVMNAHVWLNPQLAIAQVNNIAQGLAAADPVNAQAYLDNAAAYTQRLTALDDEIRALLAPFEGREIITFHEAFAYFAQAYGLKVAGYIEHESGQEPGTREIAQTCDLVKEKGIGALFVEPQYPVRTAETIARETGASVYTLDPVVSGDGAADGYERAMRANAETFAEALGK